jgi:hypothetical protein
MIAYRNFMCNVVNLGITAEHVDLSQRMAGETIDLRGAAYFARQRVTFDQGFL